MNPASQNIPGPVVPPGVYVLGSAVLLAASFPPFEVPYAAWVALVPLLLAWEQSESPLATFGQAYSVFVVAFAFAFFWPILNEFPSNGLSALVSLLVLPLAMAVPFALSAAVRQRFNLLQGFLLLFAGSLLVEAALLYGPWSFPWLVLGSTQADAGFVLQLAEIGGVLGLSLWLWIINGALFLALGTPRHWAIRFAAVVLAGVLVYGTHELSAWRLDQITPSSETLTAAIVHPNLPDDKWMEPYDDVRVHELMELSELALQPGNTRPVLIMWPEMALPVLGQPQHRERLYERVQTWVNRHQTSLLAGALTTNGGADHWDADLRFHKSAFLFRRDESFQRYDQTYLLPISQPPLPSGTFDEPSVFDRVYGGAALTGPHASAFNIGQVGFGVLLDQEAWLGGLARRQVTGETGFIAILTHSGWWSNTPGYRSQLAHARIRAVETRRSVVQVANRGLSGVVLPDGTIDVEITTRGAWPVDVPLHYSQTFYARFGEWPALLAGILFLLTGLRVAYVGLRRE